MSVKKAIIKTGGILFWLSVWQAVSMAIDRDILLPSPIQVFTRLLEMLSDRSFYLTCLNSSVHILIGFSAAIIIGIVFGLCMHSSKIAAALFSPLIKVIKSTPVASFIILALVWLQSSHIPAFISFLMVLPVICANVLQGAESIDVGLSMVSKVFRLSSFQKIKVLYAPSLLPYISAACKTGIGLAWKAGVAAEVIAVTANSIGARLRDSKTYLETTDLFAWTVALLIISVAMEFVIAKISDAVSAKFSVKSGGEVL